MSISPIITRDLQVSLRQKNPHKSRMISASFSVAVSAILLIANSPTFANHLYLWLFYGGLTLILTETLASVSYLFARERENGTIGFLFLAGLSDVDLFGGKILSSFLVSSSSLLALLQLL